MTAFLSGRTAAALFPSGFAPRPLILDLSFAGSRKFIFVARGTGENLFAALMGWATAKRILCSL
jgi:hypothetical protein